MALLANRVSASSALATMASISVTPSVRAASKTCPKMASAVSALSRIGAPDPDLAKPRRAGAMAGAHHLLGLPLAAVRHAPQGPVLRPGDGRAGIPEFGRDAAVAGVLEHAHALAVAHLPADFAPELEVIALVVDGPASVGLHVDRVVRIEHLFERLLARQQADIGHADERQPLPAIGAHAAVGARLADGRGGFPGGHIAHETAAANNIGGLRRHTFVVEREGAQPRPVFQARVAHHIDDLGAVAQPAKLVEREKAHAGVVGFAAQHAVELDGVADGFVDLQTELRAVQNQVELAFGTLIGGV